MAKRLGGMGTGLDALFEDNSVGIQPKQTVRLSELEPNKAQPRQDFDENTIAILAESIREHGVLQPLLVRPIPSGGYQIVAGERRWRACRMLGLDEVPVLIKELDDCQTMQIGLIENLQRENLNPLEEALGYKELMDNYEMTQDDIAKSVGKSRSAIANALRTLNLPDEVQQMLRKGELTAGHAKALAGIEDEQKLISLAKKAADEQITVRQIEKECKSTSGKAKARPARDSYYKEMELSLKNTLGRKVKVDWNGRKGSITLEFYNKEDLSDIAKQLAED